MKTLRLFVVAAAFISTSVLSGTRFASLEFTPHVNIHKATSSGMVDIVTKDNYGALYNVVTSSFQPIKMPFTVVSKTEDIVRYRLEYVFQQHYCKTVGEEEEIELTDEKLLINGHPFEDGFEYIQSQKEITHMLELSLTPVRPEIVEKNCYGTVGFTLKLNAL